MIGSTGFAQCFTAAPCDFAEQLRELVTYP
jgi:hypothetical protein